MVLTPHARWTFTIQCFLADKDPSNHGEGRTLVGETTATTTDPTSGDYSFTCTVGVLIPGQEITATATKTATGDTSEFSKNVLVSLTTTP